MLEAFQSIDGPRSPIPVRCAAKISLFSERLLDLFVAFGSGLHLRGPLIAAGSLL